MKPRTLAIFTLLFLFLGQLGIDLYLASMPAMEATFSVSSALLQRSITVYLALYAFSGLIVGPFSDRFGRRPILLSGLAFYVLGAFGTAFSPNIATLLILRAINGIGGGSVALFARTIGRDVFEGRALRRLSAYQTIVWAAVPLIAPLIGGIVQQYIGWHANFILMGCISALILILVYFFFPETGTKETKSLRAIFKRAAHHLTNRRFVGFTLAVSFFYAMLATFYTISPFLLQNTFNLDPTRYGLVMTLIGSGIITGAGLVGQLSRLGSRHFVYAGFPLLLLALVILSIAHDLWPLIMALFILYLALGILWPTAIGGAMRSTHGGFGGAGALVGSGAAAMGFIVTAIITLLPPNYLMILTSFEWILAILACIALFLIVKRKSYPSTRSK